MSTTRLSPRARELFDDPKTRQVAKRLLERSLAQTKLLPFCQAVDRQFKAPLHIRRIVDRFEAVERGECSRIILNTPPRHGKSRVTQLFASWYLGRHPNRNVITVSHSAELAERNSRASRAVIEDDRWPFDVKLSEDSSAMHRWNISPGGGGLYAVGVGGSITGRGADLLILDDAEHDEGSDLEQQRTFEWYQTVAAPRLEPYASIVVIATRFSAGDIVGRLLESDEGWEHISFPAIAGDDDPLGRTEGEALWPDRIPVAELLKRKSAMGSRAFNAQFLQDPIPLGGVLFHADWFTHRYDTLPENMLRIQVIDSAWRTGAGNDYSVIATWATDGRNFYVCDVWRGKLEYAQLKVLVSEKFRGSGARAICVEDSAAGIPLISELKISTGLPIIGIKVGNQRKEVRAEATTGYFEAGRVFLPRAAPWLDEWITEHLRFPNGRHDDQVDTTSMAIAKLVETLAHRQSTTNIPIGWMER